MLHSKTCLCFFSINPEDLLLRSRPSAKSHVYIKLKVLLPKASACFLSILHPLVRQGVDLAFFSKFLSALDFLFPHILT